MKQEWIDNVLCPGPLTDETIAGIRLYCEESVRRPGKFQHEPVWVPFYWAIAQLGYVDRITADGQYIADIIHTEGKETALFPELVGITYVEMMETDKGFVVGFAVKEPMLPRDYVGTEEDNEVS